MPNKNEHGLPGFGSRPRGSLVPKPIPQSYPLIESIIGPSCKRGHATTASNSTSSKPSHLDADRVGWQHKSQLALPEVEVNALFPSHGEKIRFQGLDENTFRNHTTAFPSHKAALDSMQNSFMRTEHGGAGPRGLNKEWHNGPPDCLPLHLRTLPADDDTAHGFWPTKRCQQPAAHCRSCFSLKHNLSWIDQLAARGNSALNNTLINLQSCDEDRLKDFYRSAFERLDTNASANILDLWVTAMSSEVWLRIKNTYSKELTSHDSRDILYHVLCGNHGEKLPFRQLLEALRFTGIKSSDREEVEMRLLLREIEIWRKLGH